MSNMSQMKKNGKNIYVRYMSKCIKYVFSKSCIFKKYFTYICQNIFNIYLKYT